MLAPPAVKGRPALRMVCIGTPRFPAQADWLGAAVKNIETVGERSAAGLHDDKGVMVTKIPAQSLAAKNNLQKGDVIVQLDASVARANRDKAEAAHEELKQQVRQADYAVRLAAIEVQRLEELIRPR